MRNVCAASAPSADAIGDNAAMRRLPFPAPRFRGLPAAVLVAALGLAGCASLTTPAGGPGAVAADPGAPRYPAHAAIDIDGRISVRYQQDGKEEGVHGNFAWRQAPGRTVLTLLSPLGQVQAEVEITPSRAVLARPGQPPQAAADVDALLRDALGWPLPVSDLHHWFQGHFYGADGRMASVAPGVTDARYATRQGWTLRYPAWDTEGGNIRPRRIDMERPTEQAGQVVVKLVIDRWQPQEAR